MSSMNRSSGGAGARPMYFTYSWWPTRRTADPRLLVRRCGHRPTARLLLHFLAKGELCGNTGRRVFASNRRLLVELLDDEAGEQATTRDGGGCCPVHDDSYYGRCARLIRQRSPWSQLWSH